MDTKENKKIADGQLQNLYDGDVYYSRGMRTADLLSTKQLRMVRTRQNSERRMERP